MKLIEFRYKMSRSIHKVKHYIQDHSPEILSRVGVISTVTGFGLCVKASFEAKEILDNEPHDVETAVKVASNYIPAVGAVLVGTGSHLASNRILKRRYLELGAAYFALDQSFRRYRKNVAALYGRDKEAQIRFGDKEEQDHIRGGKFSDGKVLEPSPADGVSDYARYFTAVTAPHMYSRLMQHNLDHIKLVEKQANIWLKLEGRVFLNKVYEMLGLSETLAGNAVGWEYEGFGDGHITISVYIKNIRRNGKPPKPTIIVDFNVDGDIRQHVFEDYKGLESEKEF